ncbi:MAG: helix-turn-helix domain-containing protein [Hyphomonas sp.]
MDLPRAPESVDGIGGIAAGPVNRLSTLLSGAGYPTVARRLTAHEHLYFEQDPRKGVYELLSGTVIQYALLTDARRRIEAFARPGDLLAFGHSALHDENVEALTEARLNFIPRSVFDAAVRDLPGFRDAVLERIEQMLRQARAQSALIGWKSAAQRTASFLLFLEERFRDPVTGVVRVPMTRRDIADYLGLTIETVSRMISRLKETAIIRMPSPGEFLVLDHPRLVEAAGDCEEDARQMRRNRA